MMITLEALEEMFANIRIDSPGWNLDGVLLWGYFFTDHERQRLEKAARVLEKKGYQVVGILDPSPDNDDQGLMFLHVEKVEHHTPRTLHARNAELYALAEALGVETYDGMDVGPVEGAVGDAGPR